MRRNGRGLGKPDIIYVKNFASLPKKETEEETTNTDDSTEVKDFNFKKQKFNFWK